MRFDEWEPVYEQILSDFSLSRYDDESAVRILLMVTLNSDLVEDEVLFSGLVNGCTVFGDAPCLEDDLSIMEPRGILMASGSSVHRLLSKGIVPDVVVTDLDGDIYSQLDASSRGAISVIHAHGDNEELIRTYAGMFSGPVVLTTQSVPRGIVHNFGGFTDGDRAVCLAREAGCRDILLMGFDYDNPMPKKGSDHDIKLKKLQWARRIIHDMNPPGVIISYPTD